MKPIRFSALRAPMLCLILMAGCLPAFANGSASNDLLALDQTTYSGHVDVYIDRYAAPGKDGQLKAPERYPARLLFERPDRFKLVLRPGWKNELRIVGEAGLVRWLDVSTGLSGKEPAEKVTDPLALWLLGTAGELLRLGVATDLPRAGKQSTLYAAQLDPDTYGSGVTRAIAWFSNGAPVGMELRFQDESRSFISIIRFERNIKTSPGDFQL